MNNGLTIKNRSSCKWPVSCPESSGFSVSGASQKNLGTRLAKGLAYFKVSNRHPHDQRELSDLCKIPKFGVYPGPILDEIQSLKKHQCQRPAIHIFLNKFFKFLNGCMFFNICPISTKLMDFVKLGVFFLTMWMIMH